MCFHKKIIRNPVKAEHLSGFDKPYIKVACCKCPECRKQRSNDWIFRSYWELKDHVGSCYFVTLTYRDENIPYYHGKPCFNREHIKLFLKRLRNKLGSFRYLIVPEYGELFRRPHYHFILYGISQALNLSHLDIYWIIRDTWYYGDMIDIEKLDSVQGSFYKAISYVSEYVTKDPFFDLADYEKDFPSVYDSRIQVSQGFGSKFFDYLTPDILKKGIYFLPVGKNGTDKKFSIPRYYELKVCYDYSYDPKTRKVELRKNDLGLEVAISKHNDRYDYLLDRLKSLSIIELAPVSSLINDVIHKYGYSSFQELHDFVISSSSFKYFLYHRDFIISFSEHYNRSSKFDVVFNDFYPSSSVLDDYNLQETNSLVFYNHLSGKEEFGRDYRIFYDYMSVIDCYENILDNSRSAYLEQLNKNKLLLKMYNKLKKRPDLYRRFNKYRPSFDIELINNQYSFKFN